MSVDLALTADRCHATASGAACGTLAAAQVTTFRTLVATHLASLLTCFATVRPAFAARVLTGPAAITSCILACATIFACAAQKRLR